MTVGIFRNKPDQYPAFWIYTTAGGRMRETLCGGRNIELLPPSGELDSALGSSFVPLVWCIHSLFGFRGSRSHDPSLSPFPLEYSWEGPNFGPVVGLGTLSIGI